MVSSEAPNLHLKDLNQRSAKPGAWDVTVCYPRLDTWTVPKSGKAGSAFRCLLVSHLDETAAEITMRADDKDPLDKARTGVGPKPSMPLSSIKDLVQSQR